MQHSRASPLASSSSTKPVLGQSNFSMSFVITGLSWWRHDKKQTKTQPNQPTTTKPKSHKIPTQPNQQASKQTQKPTSKPNKNIFNLQYWLCFGGKLSLESAGDDLSFFVPWLSSHFSNIQLVASQRVNSPGPFLPPRVFVSHAFHGLHFLKDDTSQSRRFLTEILPDGFWWCQNDFLNYFRPKQYVAGAHSLALIPQDFPMLENNYNSFSPL